MRLEKWKALLDRMQDDPSLRQAVQAAATANDLAHLATTLGYALSLTVNNQSRAIVIVSALESAMSDGNQPSPVGSMKDDRRGSANWDVFSQLQRTRQSEAEASQLLRPADFHAWAAVGWATPQ
jgi:predicted ribosomally synthesized peptide with nif11-like leader